MILSSIRVSGLRSIKDAVLDNCGQLNVLIGKNNSGKSNLLVAILGFFEALSAGSLVGLQPIFGATDDFHNRNTALPISISCSFGVSEQDMAQLFDEIGREFQQIANTLTQYRAAKFIKVTVKFFSRPGATSLVSKIAVSSSDHAHQQDKYVTIFEISDDVAPEIAELFRSVQAKKSEIDILNSALENFDADDYARAKNEKGISSRQLLRLRIERLAPASKVGEQTAELMAALSRLPSVFTRMVTSGRC